MGAKTKVPIEWHLNHYDKMFLIHNMNECIGDFAHALENEDIKRMESSLKLLDVAVKQLAKDKMAKDINQNPNFK